MYVGRIRAETTALMNGETTVTQLGYKGVSSNSGNASKSSKKAPAKNQNPHPFPNVDDIVDRLSNSAEITDLRIKTG